MQDNTEDPSSGQPDALWFAEFAPIVFKHGYQPIPLEGKVPFQSNWTKTTYDSLLTDLYPTANVGLLCRRTPVLDIDVSDKRVSDLIFDRMREQFPELQAAPKRTGNAPKFLWMLRTLQPFKKRKRVLVRAADGLRVVIEWLADGQQFAAIGIHPDTKQPFQWNGSGSPFTVPWESLPTITEGRADEILEAIVALLTGEGFSPAESLETGTEPAAGRLLPPGRYLPTCPVDDVPEWASQSLQRLDPDDYDQWIRVGQQLKAGRWDWGHDAWVWWSQQGSKYAPGDEDRWDGFAADRVASPEHALRSLAGTLEDPVQGLTIEPADDWRVPVIDFSRIQSESIEEYPWLIENLIPMGVPTLLSAHGGTGKSYLTLQLAVCTAAGIPFLGMPVRRGRVLVYSCEEPEREIKLRLKRILAHYVLTPDDLGGRLEIRNGYGLTTNILFNSSKIVGKRLTQHFHDFAEHAAGFEPTLVIVDNVSEVYDGSEIERAAVRQFIQSMNKICSKTGSALVLVGHVDAQTSIGKSAKGYSGSTAWHNSVRSRLYLHPTDTPGQILLSPSKNNYGAQRPEMVLLWDTSDRVWVLLTTVDPKPAPLVEEKAVSTIMAAIEKLTADKVAVRTSVSGPGNGVGVLAKETGLPKGQIREVLTELVRRRWVESVSVVQENRHRATVWGITDRGWTNMVTEAKTVLRGVGEGSAPEMAERPERPKGQSLNSTPENPWE